MYNIGKMRHKIDLLAQDTSEPVVDLDNMASYTTIKANIPAQKIKLMDKESITLKATENITRVNFVIRTDDNVEVDQYIRCEDKLYNILGYETLKDNQGFMLIATQLMR